MIYGNELFMANPMRKNYLYPIKARLSKKKKLPTSFVNYCRNSTIIGFRYFIQHTYYYTEKIFLYMSFLMLIIFLIVCANMVHTKFATKATILQYYAFSNLHNPNYNNSEWPSCAVCLENPLDETGFSSVFQRYNITDTNETRNFFKSLANTDYNNLVVTPNAYITKSHLWRQILDELAKMNVPKLMASSGKIEPFFSEAGLCFKCVGCNEDIKYFYYYGQISRALDLIVLNEDAELRSIAVYQSSTVPVWNDVTYRSKAPPGQKREWADYVSAMERILTIATPGVRQLSIQQRSCLYRDEHKLKYWPFYMQNLCMIECRIQMSMKLCGCVVYFVAPWELKDSVCNTMGMLCVARNNQNILRLKPKACNCLPDCEGARFQLTRFVTKTDVLPPNVLQVTGLLTESRRTPHAYRREVRFGLVDFIVSIGGLTGLFLGASLLSFVEFVHAIILLPIINCVKRCIPK